MKIKFTRATCWIVSKISNSGNNIKLLFLCCHYCGWLLCRNYWKYLTLWNSTSWSWLKLIFHIQFTIYLCDPYLINNCIVTGSSVGKLWPVLLNIKLKVKLRFGTFCWLLECYILFLPWTPVPVRLVLLQLSAYPSNKRAI